MIYFSTYCGAVFRSDLSEVIQTQGRAITVGYQAKLKFPKHPKTIYQYDQSPSSSNLFSLPCIYNSWNLGPNKSPSLFESSETNGSSVGKHGLQRFSRAQRLSFRPAVAKVVSCAGVSINPGNHDGILMGFPVGYVLMEIDLRKIGDCTHQVGTQRCWWGENTHCPTPLPLLTGIAMTLWCLFLTFSVPIIRVFQLYEI